jgi:hypothetical protein
MALLSPTAQGLVGSATFGGIATPTAPLYPGVTFGSGAFSGNGQSDFSQAGSYTVPRIEGGGFSISPSFDFSGNAAAFLFFTIQQSSFNTGFPAGIDTYANGGVVVAFRSGAGNWRRYRLLGSNTPSTRSVLAKYRVVFLNVDWVGTCIDLNAPGDYSDDGTFNPAAVDRIEYHVARITSATYNLRTSQSFGVRPLIISGSGSSMADLSNYFGLSGTPTISTQALSTTSDDLLFSFLPKIQIGNGSASVVFSGAFNLRWPEFRSTYPVIKKSASTFGLILRGSSSSTITLTNSSIGSIDEYLLDASSLQGTFSCNNLVVNGPATVLLNSIYNQINGGFFGCRQISLNGGILRNLSISGSTDSTSAILYRRTVGGVLTGIALSGSTSSGLSIDLENGSADLSALIIEISNNATRDILITNTGASTGTTYTLNISGITSPAGNTTTAGNRIRVTDSTASNTYDITVNASYSQGNASSAGATVNILAPSPAVTVTAVDSAQSPIAGAAVYLETSPGAVVVLNGVTDFSGVITASYSGSTPQAVAGWVRSGSGPIAYIDFPLGGNITSTGYNQTAILQQEQ